MSKKTKHFSIADKSVWSEGVRHLKKNDRVLARVIDRTKVEHRKLNEDYLEAIIDSMIYQQISGKAGDAISTKFKTLYNGKIPSPKKFLATAETRVRKAGISPQKYSYIKDLCERIESGDLELKKFKHMESEKIIEELDEVRGIGRWTAEMFLISSLGRTDVIPADDLGIRKGIQKLYKLRELPNKEQIMKLSESKGWQPYGTIASIYIWRSLDTK